MSSCNLAKSFGVFYKDTSDLEMSHSKENKYFFSVLL